MQHRDDSRRPPFNVEDAATRIAESRGNHDAYEDHAGREDTTLPGSKGQFEDLGVKPENDRAGYAQVIKETMTARDTECFHAGDDRTIFYRSSTNVFVAYDPKRPHGGTCFRPTDGRDRFQLAFDKDVLADKGLNDGRRIVTGGYDALYPKPELKPELTSNSPEPDKATKLASLTAPLSDNEQKRFQDLSSSQGQDQQNTQGNTRDRHR